MARAVLAARLRRRSRAGSAGAGRPRAARPAGEHAEGPTATRPTMRCRISARCETPLSPLGLRIRRARTGAARPCSAEPEFIKGWIEIQDEGSQIAALLSGGQPGEQVVDLCAGGGGKTLALAAMMQNHGQLYATDTDARRLAPIHERLTRAGVAQRAGPHAARPRRCGDGSRRQDRLRAGRRALHRHRHLAAQPGRQMARAPRQPGGAPQGAGRGARPRRAVW